MTALRLRPGSGEGRLLTWRAAVGAGAIGAANAALAARLPARRRLELAGVELAFIAGTYPGMAIAGRSGRATVVEIAAAGAFVALAVLGLARSSRTAIAAGLVGHGAWDAVHHRSRVGASSPTGYPAFCLIADLLLLIPLANLKEGTGEV
jgi:hypothetical protein